MNNYYTPSVEDIRVGYELEYYTKSTLGWYKLIVSIEATRIPEGYSGVHISNVLDYIRQDNWIRVLYLTKEQIAAEGWEINKMKSDNNYIYIKKGLTEGRYDMANTTLALWNWIDKQNDAFKFPAFYGSCPSINEFRYITKLLGI